MVARFSVHISLSLLERKEKKEKRGDLFTMAQSCIEGGALGERKERPFLFSITKVVTMCVHEAYFILQIFFVFVFCFKNSFPVCCYLNILFSCVTS